MKSIPFWTMIVPLAALSALMVTPLFGSPLLTLIPGALLIATVIASVHHAEVIAHRTGEPYGTIILAVAVTVIEVSLILSLMLVGGPGSEVLARDTVFAAVMIILTGIIGLCLLIGGYRHREQRFVLQGANAALITLTAITALTLILPNYTTTVPGPAYSRTQLVFVAIVSLVLYGTFLAVQTVRHRDYFLSDDAAETHAASPGNTKVVLSLFFLLVGLTAVVLLAKKLSPTIESGVENLGAPKSLVGVIVATVILLPEGLAAVKAARKNHLQTSLNLALGSALASIGLTIPAVAFASIAAGLDVTLGLDGKSMILLVLSLFTVTLSLGTGRTTILQGTVLLVLFAVYLFTTIFP
ncbi:calcium:proton antiporter [Dinghuibacter silviterrae]|nr:ionic transporter y4hA [Dinghuibacter silviterrae]